MRVLWNGCATVCPLIVQTVRARVETVCAVRKPVLRDVVLMLVTMISPNVKNPPPPVPIVSELTVSEEMVACGAEIFWVTSEEVVTVALLRFTVDPVKRSDCTVDVSCDVEM